ncbi:Fe-S cluster assembly protein SufD [Waterburya agarophytonicola K14]|uniref:Fe-S cluster assembly protein SufD n=1 Tax=Waterburya agarophytonicola KI4 TaxID=2874699 RepID=A0A964BQZ4_9CYAN|nr:Fe-S cluster assembly protein SufD [Waterburya agarophytonicola]MCC0177855.1 Fe-S cluster assembly protein SufD [Waterburya agarophytonicola KI4]
MAVQIPFATISQVTESAVVEDIFLTGLLQQCQIDKNQPQWLRDVRQQANSWLSRLSVPTRKDEDWRFIDLSDLTQTKFVTSSVMRANGYSPLEKTENSRMVFVNGIYNTEFSNINGLPKEVYVGDLNNLPQEYDAKEYFAQCHGAQDVFTSLNTAGGNNVTVIWANKNTIVETPIHLVFITDGESESIFTQPRMLVVGETGSSISLLEEYTGVGEYFTNAVTEVYLKENARVNHTRLQEESKSSYHIGKTAISQERDSHYTINEINLGAKLFRHNPEVLQQGEQTESNLNGLTIAMEEQTSDTHSIVALTKPCGNTNQLHKCIVGDRAHTVFNGKVFVTKEAQMTDATQLNRNLMLSPKARVDTKPELQITADNVKCAHGATVSQLEADEIFYLRSRGLDENDANQLLIDAFAAEIIDRLPLESLQTKITETIKQKVSN